MIQLVGDMCHGVHWTSATHTRQLSVKGVSVHVSIKRAFIDSGNVQ